MCSSLNLETKIENKLKNFTKNGNLDFFSDKGIIISMGGNIVYFFSCKGMVIPVFIGFPWGAASAYAHKRGHLLRSVFAFPIAGGHLYYPSDREARLDIARASVEMAQPYFGDYLPQYMELSYRELNSLLRDSEDYQVYALENIVPFSTLDPHGIVSPQFADIMFWDDFHILGNQNPLIVGGFNMLKLLHRYQLEAFYSNPRSFPYFTLMDGFSSDIVSLLAVGNLIIIPAFMLEPPFMFFQVLKNLSLEANMHLPGYNFLWSPSDFDGFVTTDGPTIADEADSLDPPVEDGDGAEFTGGSESIGGSESTGGSESESTGGSESESTGGSESESTGGSESESTGGSESESTGGSESTGRHEFPAGDEDSVGSLDDSSNKGSSDSPKKLGFRLTYSCIFGGILLVGIVLKSLFFSS
jgi:hypothetical protein